MQIKKGEGPGDQPGRDRFITDRVWNVIAQKTDLEIIEAMKKSGGATHENDQRA